MNAEALVGTVLGTCTLQQLIGQGGMGAVYLAQQSRPRRQVAVKVLLPATTMKPQHLAAFLERFRRETDAAASLEHPNIMPVYEYGERDGLAYLVMPYISGGTLRDVMEREGQMILPKTINYLEQLAAALDFAHARGVIHRDIKPANILLTPEGRLLLTDFGLVKILTEEGQAQVRLTGAGAPVGTPDYMSPEQVMGHEVDGRADLYSLGIILFQMLTATTPFQGETPMQIAAQQLHAQPPSPRRFRGDLPIAAEQVILKTLSKRPQDRYANGLELATAFRLSLTMTDTQSTAAQTNSFAASSIGGSGVYSRRGLFDPKWQAASLPSMENERDRNATGGSIPIASQEEPARSSGLLSRTGMFPRVGSGNTGAVPAASFSQNPATPTSRLSPATGAQQIPPLAFQPGMRDFYGSANATWDSMIPTTPVGSPDPFAQSEISQMSPSMQVSTGALMAPQYDRSSQTVKLTGPVKVVQVPVAPGRFVTGLLPVPQLAPPRPPENPRVKLLKKVALLAVVMLIMLGGTFGFLLVRSHVNRSATSRPGTGPQLQGTPNLAASQAAQATAMALSNIILYDPLKENIRDLPEGTSATHSYAFKNNSYHITNLGKQGVAVVVQYNLPSQWAYQLTMQEIRGDDTSAVNSFGMIFRYNQQANAASTFYSFEVVNTPGGNGKYWFYKYDSSKANPWMALWSQTYGSEFHQGHAANSINTFKVIANGSSFSFMVNGKLLGKPVVDKSFATGDVGMLVNLDGTEVAFSNLLITTITTPKK
ncbi:MAG TPA: protein kinase [Ktedonobacteraceae bacterium]|nr:protein kinase [Ktedonobacteraceae bacterium]